MEEKTLYRIIKPVVDAWNQGRDESLQLSCKYEEYYIEIVPKEDNPHIPGALLTDIAMLAVVYNFAYGVHLNINGTPQILL